MKRIWIAGLVAALLLSVTVTPAKAEGAANVPNPENVEISIQIPEKAKLIINPYGKEFEAEGQILCDDVYMPVQTLSSLTAGEIVVTAQATGICAGGARFVDSYERFDCSKNAFIWFEFQNATDDTEPVWSGAYTGAENQVVVNGESSQVLRLPTFEDGEPVKAVFRAFGMLDLPLEGMWGKDDIVDVSVSFEFALADVAAPVEDAQTSEDEEPVEDAQASDVEELVENAEPSDVAEPVEDADPSDAAEPVGDAEASDVAEPVGDAEPSDVAEPVEDAQPSDDTQAVEDAEPSDVAEPVGDAEASDAAEPVDDDAQASDAAEPVEDAELSDVAEPVEDAEPSDDTEPVEDAEPSDVAAPVGDAEPSDAAEPVGDAEVSEDEEADQDAQPIKDVERSGDTEIIEDAAESFQD